MINKEIRSKVIENNITYDCLEIDGDHFLFVKDTNIKHRIDWLDGSSWFYFEGRKISSKEEYEKLYALRSFT